MAYIEMDCESALNHLKRNHPYRWDLNIYRGCEHGCKYCYAMHTNRYMQINHFYNDVYVKMNAPERLERELQSSSWQRQVINIGGVTDSYQPAEANYQLMPEILKILIKYRNPVIISTKSDLILRDFDLIDQLSRVAAVNIAATVTTVDETIRSRIEPGGAAASSRFSVLKELTRTKASTGLHIMPVIPGLTDDYQNIDSLLSCARDAAVSYVLPGILYLRGQTRAYFFEFIGNEYPWLTERLSELYRGGGASRDYKKDFYQMYHERQSYYGLTASYSEIYQKMEKPQEYIQLSLFDL